VNNEENGISRHILDNIVNQKIEDFKNESEIMQQRKKDLILLFESVIIKINNVAFNNQICKLISFFHLESNSNNLHK
jgi:hypothetical protein